MGCKPFHRQTGRSPRQAFQGGGVGKVQTFDLSLILLNIDLIKIINLIQRWKRIKLHRQLGAVLQVGRTLTIRNIIRLYQNLNIFGENVFQNFFPKTQHFW